MQQFRDLHLNHPTAFWMSVNPLSCLLFTPQALSHAGTQAAGEGLTLGDVGPGGDAASAHQVSSLHSEP